MTFFEQVLRREPGPDDTVFLRPDGKPWGMSQQQRPMSRACERAGIAPAIGFHILRHTYASRLVRRGISMTVIASQIGDSEATCAKYYAHLCSDYAAEQIRAGF